MAKSDDQLTDDRSTDDERWFGGRRWTGYFAVGFAVVLLLCVGILVLVRNGNPSASGQAVAAPSTAATSATLASTGAASATTPPSTGPSTNSPMSTATATAAVSSDVALPTAAPTGTTWQLVAGQALPSEQGVGPAHVQGYTASGYAHTPLGALYAAVNDFYRVPIAVTADADWQTPLKVMVVPGPGVNVLAALRKSLDPRPMGPEGAGINQLAAFKYVSFTASDAVIQLVVIDKNSSYHVATVPMRWSSNDWRVVMTSDGTIGGADTTVDSLSGYVTWQGVS